MKTRVEFKNLILTAFIFIATTSSAFAQSPNHFRLQGDNLNVTYSTTSFTGRPYLSYDNGVKIRNFSGDEIRTVGTEIGTFVSVTLWKTKSGFTTFTLLIPKSDLGSENQIYLQTQGTMTQHKFSIDPNQNVGQLNVYKYILMKGSANLMYY